jgi:hypothetical protein
MYWANLGRLKKDLIDGRLSEHNAFPYFLAVLIVDSLLINSTLGYSGEFDPNIVFVAQVLVPVSILIVATLLLYRVNGGANGKAFFIRYFTLIWVVGIRFVPFVLALMGVWLHFVAFESEQYSPDWLDLAMWDSIYALFYWRVWVHFRDVQSHALAT